MSRRDKFEPQNLSSVPGSPGKNRYRGKISGPTCLSGSPGESVPTAHRLLEGSWKPREVSQQH